MTAAAPPAAWAVPTAGSSDVAVQRVQLTDKNGTEAAGLQRATKAAGSLVTAEMDVRAFRLMGLTWSRSDGNADGMKVEARFRLNGKWQDWVAVASGEADPDGADSKKDGTTPYLTGVSDGIQLRISGKGRALPADLSLSLLSAETTAADQKTVRTPRPTSAAGKTSMSAKAPTAAMSDGAGTASSLTSDPVAVAGLSLKSRSDWGADESLADPGFKTTGTVNAAIVHHTVEGNDYTAAEVPALMRSIYVYLITEQGYGDFPYNFVVDKFGNTWEGRRGSIDANPDAPEGSPKAILGGHASGFNTDTLGVAALGNFEPDNSGSGPNPQPSGAMMDGLAATLAWKLRQYGRDPLGQAQLTSGGGTGNPNPPGSVLTVKTISGHRDVNQTLCPGTNLYAKLDTLRTKVSDLMNADGQVLRSGAAIESATGKLTMQTDGNLVLSYRTGPEGKGGALWHTATYGNPGAYATVQADGNFVVYSATRTVLWASGTYGNRGASLKVQDDGNLVVAASNGSPLWSSGTYQRPTKLAAGQNLTAGAWTQDAKTALLMQADGDLTVVDRATGQTVWASNTWGPGAYARMQADGNLVIYKANGGEGKGGALWHTATYGNPGAYLRLQADGNAVVYHPDGRALWNAGTWR